jgi:hypothetical protein
MWTGTQFVGTLPAGASARWSTYGWPVNWNVVWYMMPTTPNVGAPQLEWSVAVERADAANATYWITVTNLASIQVDFEGRFAVM